METIVKFFWRQQYWLIADKAEIGIYLEAVSSQSVPALVTWNFVGKRAQYLIL
jgi:hypothetical protein